MAASPARADVLVVYTGTVSSGADQTGVFGPSGSSLDGDSFMVTYVFDPTLGNTYSSSTENYAEGGTYLGVENPAISATITINSVSVSIVSIFLGYNNVPGSEQFDETTPLLIILSIPEL
jgi:hypothetical protein